MTNLDVLFPRDKYYGGISNYEEAKKLTTNTIKNYIWMASNGFAIPGSVSLRCLRKVLISRGEDPHGYHNT